MKHDLWTYLKLTDRKEAVEPSRSARLARLGYEDGVDASFASVVIIRRFVPRGHEADVESPRATRLGGEDDVMCDPLLEAGLRHSKPRPHASKDKTAHDFMKPFPASKKTSCPSSPAPSRWPPFSSHHLSRISSTACRKNYSTEQVVLINKDYKPPSLLQVDRATRAQFAKSYYANSIFVLDGRTPYKFIDVLPLPHVKHMRHVHAAVKDRSRFISGDGSGFYVHNFDLGVSISKILMSAQMWNWLAREGLAEKNDSGIFYAGVRVASISKRTRRCCRATPEESLYSAEDDETIEARFSEFVRMREMTMIQRNHTHVYHAKCHLIMQIATTPLHFMP
ncbi:uncharacterized protein MYCFIDRAFT_209059 [Pseudocercospora fijiensis CIRAD86]|uniref:Uncharacterized protein n=1 Tax=Pseudocercospora fijiensis (strain CIRAD86) TaxID=383855 RepID=M3A2V2_PSEFD|nr:uncharacterized protein MYCFIDRAFT_209059 [Pseudocercospora fijiensis CIRAD86]EME78736.1 hypothetical protein MYCFIDRAFT_209059 [Pseudocercospora fijiensis CIRAD86]